MENEIKSLRDYIKEAEAKGCYVVLLGEEAEIGKHIALIEKLSLKDDVMLVRIADLPQREQELIVNHTRPATMQEMLEHIPYKSFEFELHEMLPEPIILNESVSNYQPAPTKVALPKSANVARRKDFNHRRQ